MKFPSPVPVKWIAELIGAELMGNTEGMATGINEIHRVEPGDLVFVDHPKYYDHCIRSNASFIIIDKPAEFPDGKALLVTEKPFEAYQKIVLHFQPFRAQETMRGENLRIGEDTYIGPGTYLGYNVTIGSGCRIGPNVTILDHTEIGNRVVIQAGTVIGSDAFYYNSRKDREVWYRRMESCGKVVLEDEVEIGAGCTIDRGVTHDTRVGRGTKIDNMVHIGHDSLVGRNCLIAAQVGIAGVVEIGNGVILWGQAGVSKTLSIGDNAVVLAQSGVPSSLAGGKTYFGSPAEDASIKRRELVWIKRIPEIWEKLKHLRP